MTTFHMHHFKCGFVNSLATAYSLEDCEQIIEDKAQELKKKKRRLEKIGIFISDENEKLIYIYNVKQEDNKPLSEILLSSLEKLDLTKTFMFMEKNLKPAWKTYWINKIKRGEL